MTKAAFDKIAEGLNEALEVVKADAPSRIYATVNGASTRLPGGGRQLVGGWRERPDSPRTVEYIRADLVEGMKVALADLLSWFPDKPTEPEWRIKAGNYGADDALKAARAALTATEKDNG